MSPDALAALDIATADANLLLASLAAASPEADE